MNNKISNNNVCYIVYRLLKQPITVQSFCAFSQHPWPRLKLNTKQKEMCPIRHSLQDREWRKTSNKQNRYYFRPQCQNSAQRLTQSNIRDIFFPPYGNRTGTAVLSSATKSWWQPFCALAQAFHRFLVEVVPLQATAVLRGGSLHWAMKKINSMNGPRSVYKVHK